MNSSPKKTTDVWRVSFTQSFIHPSIQFHTSLISDDLKHEVGLSAGSGENWTVSENFMFNLNEAEEILMFQRSGAVILLSSANTRSNI